MSKALSLIGAPTKEMRMPDFKYVIGRGNDGERRGRSGSARWTRAAPWPRRRGAQVGPYACPPLTKGLSEGPGGGVDLVALGGGYQASDGRAASRRRAARRVALEEGDPLRAAPPRDGRYPRRLPFGADGVVHYRTVADTGASRLFRWASTSRSSAAASWVGARGLSRDDRLPRHDGLPRGRDRLAPPPARPRGPPERLLLRA